MGVKACDGCQGRLSFTDRWGAIACPYCGRRYHLVRGVALNGSELTRFYGLWLIAAGLLLFGLVLVL